MSSIAVVARQPPAHKPSGAFASMSAILTDVVLWIAATDLVALARYDFNPAIVHWELVSVLSLFLAGGQLVLGALVLMYRGRYLAGSFDEIRVVAVSATAVGVVAETAHRVQVMYAGQVVERQATAGLFATPRHPYTAALLDALPERAVGRRRLPTIPGVVPGIDDRPEGCLFAPRCQFATELCVRVRPELGEVPGGSSRCHYPLDDFGRPTGHPERQAA